MKSLRLLAHTRRVSKANPGKLVMSEILHGGVVLYQEFAYGLHITVQDAE